MRKQLDRRTREFVFAVLPTNIKKNAESDNCLPPKEVVGGRERRIRNYMQVWMDVDSSSNCNLIGI